MPTNPRNSVQSQRRNFLKFSAAAVGASLLANPIAATAAVSPSRTLRLKNVHTGERIEVEYKHGDKFDENGLTRLNYFLRDHRQNEATLMDPRLFDQLWEIQNRCGGNTEFEIISAYRSPKTNAMLRKKSNNVARKSYHVRGQALDIRAVGVSTRTLCKNALGMKQGGVGYYPGTGFVHIDTGPVRNWRG